jgi:hypothetical protein
MVSFETNLAESPKEGYDSKEAVFLVTWMDTNYGTPRYEHLSIVLLSHDPLLKKIGHK